MSKQVADFSFEDLGVDSPSYFQGAGVAYTTWDDVFVGTGDTAREAADDALANAYDSQIDYDTYDDMEREASKLDDIASAHDDCEPCCDDSDNCEHENAAEDECELQHYVALYVRYAAEEVTP